MRKSLALAFVFAGNLLGQTASAQDTMIVQDPVRVPLDSVVEITDTLPVQQEYLRLNWAYVKTIPQGFLYTVKQPFHWKGKDWKRAGIAGLAIGTTLVFDYEIKKFTQANRTTFGNEVSRVVEPFGNNYFPFIMMGMLAAGKITKDRKMEHASLMGARSLLVSTAVYTTFKGFTRRNRPAYTDNPFDFHTPFKKEYTSFPSGHTNTAISVATALALEYKHIKWVPVACYSIAGLTAVSRIYDNRHWASDVLVGGLMGHFITRGLYYWEQKRVQQKAPKTPPVL
ncbi:phosphatase PAP2 family protein [Parasegetibacter sp. NRK P23]|uniref:phosphatase PAP2 family protein n=1 Tax=Parasegetibacter sp. NRK P23 TaxID=2942999 RepID=UPI0020438711|nr:phosphatase PAP2 family protein [Parasegetibacter sp. NRK P23]MCM5526835.1 phosphatase PAP2 family protein [Parasegetibacter sp. NRK P23]